MQTTPLVEVHSGGRFDLPPIQVIPAAILRIQGYKDLSNTPNTIVRLAEKMASTARELFLPDLRYRILPLSAAMGDRSVLGARLVASCGGEEHRFSRCGSLAAFVLTMGCRLDEELDRLRAAGDMAEAVMLESAGWLGIEKATTMFAKWLHNQGRDKGFVVSRRYAPGYGSWPLTGQQALFAAFDASSLPMTLLESCAITPKMSRSGVYGLTEASGPRMGTNDQPSRSGGDVRH